MREETVMTALPESRPRAARADTSGGPDTFPGRERPRGERILCGLLAASAALCFLNVMYMALTGTRSPLLLAAFQIMPVLVVAGHAALAKGWRRAALFASTCFFLGFLAEVMGVRYGLLFGGHYTYLDVDVACGGVPLIIPVFWVIFIYISHCMLNTFLLFLGKKKPARESGGVPGLLLVIALDGALAVIFDVIMDPIMVKAGKWQWADGGTYHGVPLGNFLGWFVLACLASGSFRVFEYLRPRPEPQFAKRFHLVPAVGYATALFGFIIYAITIDLLAIIPVALLLMGSVLAANLVLYAGLGRKRAANGQPFGRHPGVRPSWGHALKRQASAFGARHTGPPLLARVAEKQE